MSLNPSEPLHISPSHSLSLSDIDDLCSSPINSNDSTVVYGYPPEFTQQLSTIIEAGRLNKIDGHFLLLSIENLAMVISAYGHNDSEIVLADLQKQIENILSHNDVVERIQRDQFGIILSNTNEEEATYIQSRIASIIKHFGINSEVGSLHLVASFAQIMLPIYTQGSVQEVLDDAYIALKQERVGMPCLMERGLLESSLCRQEMGLANYLNRAIEEHRVRLAYQPIVDAKTGKIVHYEALLRAVGEDGTLSSAGALIPIAERMGLIQYIDRMVLDMVVEELRRAPDVVLAMNISNITTKDKQWLIYFEQLLLETPEIAPRLIIEITETAVHLDLSRTASFVAAIQAQGAMVALDDFGSGYTSFRQLKTLSLDMVKIDGAFIRDLADNSDSQFFVKTLLEFTKGFGLKSVAEFVENGEVAKILMELGVDYIQGYYFGKPENRRPWLEQN